jgi:hypothetical protein
MTEIETLVAILDEQETRITALEAEKKQLTETLHLMIDQIAEAQHRSREALAEVRAMKKPKLPMGLAWGRDTAAED